VKQVYRKLAAHARGERVADSRDIQLVARGAACDRQAHGRATSTGLLARFQRSL
jgi:hypothetical protein